MMIMIMVMMHAPYAYMERFTFGHYLLNASAYI